MGWRIRSGAMDESIPPQNEDEYRRTRTQQARAAYEEARKKVRFARSPQGGTPNHYEYFVQDVSAAAVDLMLTGLDEWLAAGAKDRASAELDRLDQRRARWAMIALTIAIVVVGVLGFLKPSAPVPAPIVNIQAPAPSPAPMVNVSPVLNQPAPAVGTGARRRKLTRE